MNSSFFLGITTFIYLFTMVLYFYYLFFKHPRLAMAIKVITAVGLLAHTAGLGLRWYWCLYQAGYGHIPLANLYETLASMSWCMVLVLLIMEQRFKNVTLGAFVFPIASIAMAYASLPKVSSEIQPLIPALQSNWLIAHVMTCFVGYAAFAVAFGISILFLSNLLAKIKPQP